MLNEEYDERYGFFDRQWGENKREVSYVSNYQQLDRYIEKEIWLRLYKRKDIPLFEVIKEVYRMTMEREEKSIWQFEDETQAKKHLYFLLSELEHKYKTRILLKKRKGSH